MLDYNSSASLSERVTTLINDALASERDQQTPRTYLGGSRLGVSCDRALQYEYLQTPVDLGREFSGTILRIFEAGHVFEELAIRWLRMVGFEIHTETSQGNQYGFSAADGRIQGHVDGILSAGPDSLKLSYPALWECKSLNNIIMEGYGQARPDTFQTCVCSTDCTLSGVYGTSDPWHQPEPGYLHGD